MLPDWAIYVAGGAGILGVLAVLWFAAGQTSNTAQNQKKPTRSGSALFEQVSVPEVRPSTTESDEPPLHPITPVLKPKKEPDATATRTKERVEPPVALPTTRQSFVNVTIPRLRAPLVPQQSLSTATGDREAATSADASLKESPPTGVDLADFLPGKVDGGVATLLEESQHAAEKFAEDKAKTTDGAKLKLLLKRDPANTFALKLVELGEKEPAANTGYQAFVAAMYVVRDSDVGLTNNVIDRAVKHLTTDCLTNPEIGRATLLAASLPHRAARRLIQSVLDKSTHRDARGLACFALLKNLQSEREQTTDPVSLKRIDKQVAKLVQRIDRQEFGEVSIDDRPLAEAVKALAAPKPQLSLGSPAPEIVGKDLEGARIKLSDYRGKVVMLVFWANWCPYCRSLLPYERELVSKMEDRPFVLLGVNVDKRADAAAIQRKKITSWPSWQDGPSGPISAKWHIKGYPTVFVLDRKGTIRWTGYTPDVSFYGKVIEHVLAEGGPKDESKSARRDQAFKLSVDTRI
ncbi:MAG TPA: redoxin domain-containing protein [Planctomycetaceae bacterium]|jgi:thiol-disulfide isomerase/thioredoxin|nr:redoxin domain-containing protein [Planctomycetaceae bacterium]